jgi:deazaflavin-dependent oxidoreductase (nitroreductase family)
MPDYRPAPWLYRHTVNPIIELIVGPLGLPLRGAALLTVTGRKSGKPRTVVVYPLSFDGQRYLVAPRGETDWVRNLRAAGSGELRRGRRRRPIVAAEVPDAEKPPIFRAYLDRWYLEAGSEFRVPKGASLEELAAIANRHPVFRYEHAPTSM